MFEQSKRPSIKDIVGLLLVVNSLRRANRVDTDASSGESSECSIHLKVSQASFFQKCTEVG